ncbi:MAG: hypothetical protein IK031_07445 [Bacteroidales bacterium]|nr:hypothetical protein [Bacteroidales bacterium]
MKSLYKLSIVFAGALLASCMGDLEPLEPVIPEPTAETKTLSFVLPSDGFKTKWQAGDQIVIHGEYAADEVTVTLAAGDISSDGKKASCEVKGLFPYIREDCASTLYASWPANLSSNLRHCFFYSGFKPDTATPLLAACNSGDTFQFSDVSSAIEFIVKGDYDSFALSGRKDAVVGYEYYQVKLTDKEQNYSQYKEGPMVTVSGPVNADGKTVQRIYLSGDVNLPAGYILKFFKDGKALMALTDKEPLSVERGKVINLGDITGRLKEFELEIDVSKGVDITAEAGTANCYIVTEPGIYKFPAVKGNTTDGIGAVDYAEILWETWNNTEEVTRKSVVQACTYEGGYVYFQIPDALHPGNALIAAKDEDDNILWSWHIWVPRTPVTEQEGPNFGAKPILSRNLGALVDATIDSPTPVESFGLLYQWGRKDPFPGLGVLSGDTPITVAGTAMTVVDEQSTVAGAVQHPTVLYHVAKGDWQSEGLDVASTLWGEGKKTVYDPCPAGYTMPTRNKSYAFWGSSMYGASYFVLNEANCSFAVDDQIFPLAGHTTHEEGAYTGAGLETIVWSGRWDSGTQNGYGMFGTAGESPKFKNQGNIRSMAGSVRCVVL